MITARTAGFCFGVEKAVSAVYKEAEGGGKIVTFGPIIHNETVVSDLEKRGVYAVSSLSEVKDPEHTTVVIRSHGVPEKVMEELEGCGARIVDTTCTFVKRIHEIVRKASKEGKHVVIIGNHGHAEVEGTMGWCVTPATVIETKEEAEAFDLPTSVPLCVVAQTTFAQRRFEELVDILKIRGYNIDCNNTICSATRERQSEARRIAAEADAMIVIGGKGSSNTRKLYEICREVCPKTFFIQTADDLGTLSGKERIIGITAGASTPGNIIKEVQNRVRRAEF